MSQILCLRTEDGEPTLITSRSARFEVKPLDFAALLKLVRGETDLTLEISNVNITPDQLKKDLPQTAWIDIKAEPIYGLVVGGWLPMPWAHQDIAFLDSNMVIAVENIAKGKSQQYEAIDNFLGLDVQRVSPVLYALEGTANREVSELEFNRHLDEAEQDLQKFLPPGKLHSLDNKQRAGIYSILRHQLRDQAADLVLEIAPMIADQVAANKRLGIETKIFKAAVDRKLALNSLVVMALLSCVYDGGSNQGTRAATPGRTVIKPNKTYDRKQAYAAVADLYMLEFLFNIQTFFPDSSTVLYTKDCGLTALWTSLQPSQLRHTALPNGMHQASISFPLDRCLFPALEADDTLKLKERVLAFSDH